MAPDHLIFTPRFWFAAGLLVLAGASLAVPAPAKKDGGTQSPPRADARNDDGTYGKDHVDPVKLNGPIFVNWPKPRAALVFTGGQNGYIEPCGCAGLENQKGGMSRRHQLFKQLSGQGWPLAAFDAGGLIKRFGRQSELKYAASVDGLKIMGYQAVGFGADDLRLPTDELIAAATSVDDKASPFVATNVALLTFDDKLVDRAKIVSVGGLKIGIAAILGDSLRKQVRNSNLEFKPAAAALAEVLPDLRKAKCDKLVLLAHATVQESTELAKRFPAFDFVVTSDGADEPPAQPTPIAGTKSQLIEVGHKGMYAVVLGLYDDAKTPLRYQRVPLDARFGESEEIKQVLVSYQEQLKEAGLSGLGIKPVPHPSGRKFAGSKACGECHTRAYATWENTPHAHATETLVKLSPQRHFDPECLSCHATGWEPQRYFPFASGFLGLKETPHLTANGCENCHGPGSNHAAKETALQAGEIDEDDAQIEFLRDKMRVTVAEAAKNGCVQCHDQDNSPEFKFETYWPKVKHVGKD